MRAAYHLQSASLYEDNSMDFGRACGCIRLVFYFVGTYRKEIKKRSKSLILHRSKFNKFRQRCNRTFLRVQLRQFPILRSVETAQQVRLSHN